MGYRSNTPRATAFSAACDFAVRADGRAPLARAERHPDAGGGHSQRLVRIDPLGDHEVDQTGRRLLHEEPAHELRAELVADALDRRYLASISPGDPLDAAGIQTRSPVAWVTTNAHWRISMR